MNYEAMSDFEINKSVLKAHTGGLVCNIRQHRLKKLRAFKGRVLFDLTDEDDDVFGEVDYCNIPADMWPIIIQNNIELSPLYRGEWCASVVNNYTYNEDPIYDLQHAHANPLRAAAIVFLMMKEAEK